MYFSHLPFDQGNHHYLIETAVLGVCDNLLRNIEEHIIAAVLSTLVGYSCDIISIFGSVGLSAITNHYSIG